MTQPPGFDHQPPQGQPAYGQPVYDKLPFGPQHTPQAYDQNGQPFYFPDLEGAAYKSKATMFAVIGIFILGFIFGPLAILNAGRAEANGVPATFGKSPAGSSPSCRSCGCCSSSSWSSLLLPLGPQPGIPEHQALTKQPPHLLCILGRGNAEAAFYLWLDDFTRPR